MFVKQYVTLKVNVKRQDLIFIIHRFLSYCNVIYNVFHFGIALQHGKSDKDALSQLQKSITGHNR